MSGWAIQTGEYSKKMEEDFKKYIKYISDRYSFCITGDIKDLLKENHKKLWILFFIKRTLEEENIYFNEIIKNFLSMSYVLVEKNQKIISFLLRNSIENFLKFLKIKYENIDLNSLPKDLFSSLFDVTNQDTKLKDILSNLKSENYQKLCLDVHNSNLLIQREIQSSVDCLIELDEEKNKIMLKNEMIEKTFYKFIVIYFYIFPKKILDIPGDHQLILREYFNRDELKEIFDRIGQK